MLGEWLQLIEDAFQEKATIKQDIKNVPGVTHENKRSEYSKQRWPNCQIWLSMQAQLRPQFIPVHQCQSPSLSSKNTDILEPRFCWNFCPLQEIKLLQHNLKSLEERRKKIGQHWKTQKFSIFEPWRTLVGQITRENQQIPGLFPSALWRCQLQTAFKPKQWMTWLTRSCWFFACLKNGLSQFPLWMKM